MAHLRELKIKFAGEMGVSAAFMDDKFYLFLNGAENRFETTRYRLAFTTESRSKRKFRSFYS